VPNDLVYMSALKTEKKPKRAAAPIEGLDDRGDVPREPSAVRVGVGS